MDLAIVATYGSLLEGIDFNKADELV
jgi:hypothetical protein